MLHAVMCLSVCNVCIAAKRCVIELKLLLIAYRKWQIGRLTGTFGFLSRMSIGADLMFLVPGQKAPRSIETSMESSGW